MSEETKTEEPKELLCPKAGEGKCQKCYATKTPSFQDFEWLSGFYQQQA